MHFIPVGFVDRGQIGTIAVRLIYQTGPNLPARETVDCCRGNSISIHFDFSSFLSLVLPFSRWETNRLVSARRGKKRVPSNPPSLLTLLGFTRLCPELGHRHYCAKASPTGAREERGLTTNPSRPAGLQSSGGCNKKATHDKASA